MNEFLIALLGIGGVGGSATLLWYYLRGKKNKKKEPPLPPETALPEIQPPPKQPDPPRPESPEKQQAAGKTSDPETQIREIIQQIISHIHFSAKRVLVGRRVVGQRSLGFEHKEVAHPADDVLIRPIFNPSEIADILAPELAADDDILYGRIASGEALVAKPLEEREIFEDIYEDVYEDRRRILYVLLDISLSMFPECSEINGKWRPKIWRPLTLTLLEYAFGEEVIFLLREFSGKVGRLYQITNREQMRELQTRLSSVGGEPCTNIPLAISAAISDFKKQDYNEAEIVIITDGENNHDIDIPDLRGKLEGAGIRLHAVLLGVKNDALRAVADVYQIIEKNDKEGFVLHKLAKN